MSPLKRTARAAAKQRAGRHRRPEPEPLRGGPYPLTRTPLAQVLLNPHTPGTEVPPELVERDYEFPQVPLPASRPLVDHTQLLAALEGDDTQALDMATVLDGELVDEAPQPAQHEGLAPVPVPSPPFLNAHPPQAEPEPQPDPQPESATWLHVGNALPAALTSVELMLLDRPITADAPPAVRPAAPQIPPPVRRDREHRLVFGAFDGDFWRQIQNAVRQTQAGPGSLEMSNDDAMTALDEHLDRVERRHRAWDALVPWLYAGTLDDAARTLPRRTPGAALAAIEGSRGELVDA